MLLVARMAPKRSNAQKEALVAARVVRHQERSVGGDKTPTGETDAGGNVTPAGESDAIQRATAEATLESMHEVQRAKAAQEAAEAALESIQCVLQAEHKHRKELYLQVRAERRKVIRATTSKEHAEAHASEAQSTVESLEDKLQQMTLREEQLQLTMSQLLENWAKETHIAEKTLQECRQAMKSLYEECQHAPERLRETMEKTKAEGHKFSLMERGVYTNEARELCRVLVNAGCSQGLVGKVIEEVLTTAGVSVVGPTMSRRTVSQSIQEGGIMADMQIAYEITKTHGLTVSCDGTTHKNVNYESRHVNMLVPDYGSEEAKHRSRLIGVDSASDHSSQTQADAWISKIQEKFDAYNQSPLGKRSQHVLRLADFFACLRGMNSDHANDQKKLAALLKRMKQDMMQKSLGEDVLLHMNMPDLLVLLSDAKNQKIEAVGGLTKWNALSDEEKLKADVDIMSTLVLKLGCEAYSQLSDEEKHTADFFIWVGCGMHKDLNCIKGGNATMICWWEENDVPGPVLLANKDNAAVLNQIEDEDDQNPAHQRALDLSSGGGVKLASLAGMLFNNKNDKIGQQDIHQQFFLSRGHEKRKFPDTSNTRYQSYSAAAADLLTTLPLYLEFMRWIRDGKERPGFTNMEKNVYNGLQDIPTQTELAVLALYAQAISHPYMRQVREPGTEHVNMLNLGPHHLKVQMHLENVISDPSIILPPTGSYESGSMDGEPWENPEAVAAIYKLAPSLPHLKPVLVAFFKGALVTWIRFTAEFEEGGLIDTATAEEKEHAWMPPTNDVNEGALGALRIHLRKKPKTTIHQYNALAMFKFNDTPNFVHHVFLPEDHAYVRQQARMRDGSHLERERKTGLIAYRDKEIDERREKTARKAQQKNHEQTRLAALTRMEDLDKVTIDMSVVELKDQLEIYRGLVTGIPLKSHLKTKAAMIEALQDAITKYKGEQGN
jgi:hypothetical protein